MSVNTDPLVTIAIPTFNRAGSHLREAIESALNQSYERVEIIVSDNCSEDNTRELVEEFGESKVRYFRQKTNIGHNNNFNYCLEQAKGEYFLLLSDDDVIDHDFVETCLSRRGDLEDIALIHSGVRVIDAESKVQYEVPNQGHGKSIVDFTRSWFKNRKAIYLCATMFKTGQLRESGGFASKHNLCQDMMAQFRLAATGGWIDVREVKASVRRHPGEITHTAKIRPSCEDNLSLLDLICGLCPETERSAIRKEGMRYFAARNHGLASMITKRSHRYLAYLVVLQVFGIGNFPLWSRMGAFGGALRGEKSSAAPNEEGLPSQGKLEKS